MRGAEGAGEVPQALVANVAGHVLHSARAAFEQGQGTGHALLAHEGGDAQAGALAKVPLEIALVQAHAPRQFGNGRGAGEFGAQNVHGVVHGALPAGAAAGAGCVE